MLISFDGAAEGHIGRANLSSGLLTIAIGSSVATRVGFGVGFLSAVQVRMSAIGLSTLFFILLVAHIGWSGNLSLIHGERSFGISRVFILAFFALELTQAVRTLSGMVIFRAVSDCISLFAILLLIRTEAGWLAVRRSLKGSALFGIVIGAIWLLVGGESSGTLGRTGSLFSHPNTFAQLGLIFLIFGWYSIHENLRRAIAISIVSLSVVAISGSRSYLMASLVFMVIHLTSRGEKRAFRIAALLVSVPVAILALGAASVGTRLQSQGVGDLNNRDTIWPTALDAILTEPLIGHGFRQTPNVFDNYRATGAGVDFEHDSVHNAFLQMQIELGLLGSLMVILFACHFVYSSRASSCERVWVSGSMLALLTTQLVSSSGLLPVTIFRIAIMSIIFYVLSNNKTKVTNAAYSPSYDKVHRRRFGAAVSGYAERPRL